MQHLTIYNNKRTYINNWGNDYERFIEHITFPIIFFNDIAIDTDTWHTILYYKYFKPLKWQYGTIYRPDIKNVLKIMPKQSNILRSFKRQAYDYKNKQGL